MKFFFKLFKTIIGNYYLTFAAFLWCRIYRVYDFRVGNNVLVTSELVFTSRELVKKKAARVGEWLATFTLFPLSPVQKAGNNATDRVSCTNYFMSIEIIRCSVRRIKTTKPDKKQAVAKSHCIFSIWRNNAPLLGYRERPMTVVLMPRMQTSRAYEFMGVNPPSFPSIPPHENAAFVLNLIKIKILNSYI